MTEGVTMSKPDPGSLFDRYQPVQRERLRRLVGMPEWASLLERGAALERMREAVRIPPSAPYQQIQANKYLRERNGDRTLGLLGDGVTEEKVLLSALGDWETALSGDDPFPIAFLGLVLTLDCSFLPRCLYCNQISMPRVLGLPDWKALVAEAASPIPPYVYLTGGEPLMLCAEVWGDHGLVAFATDLGCAVNINTNAALITPSVALQLVKVGTARLHISLDADDAGVQDGLLGAADRMDAVQKGIFNIQVAREVLGVNHPEIHINCVLTAQNIFQFPDLLRFLLAARLPPPAGSRSLLTDFAFHLIPVGGGENSLLRPTAKEWKRFHTETWAEAEEIWRTHLTDLGVPAREQGSLADHVPFANPWLRADHGMSLDEYCDLAGRGEYWQGALTDRCYVAPTQAFVLPDGSQHWCGAHAIRRPEPIGNVLEAGLRENIRRNISRLKEHPNESCTGCAGATCVINQAAERNLREQVATWIEEHS